MKINFNSKVEPDTLEYINGIIDRNNLPSKGYAVEAAFEILRTYFSETEIDTEISMMTFIDRRKKNN